MIITKTPFRMSFFGGGTDMESFFKENGGAVLSTTFDKYCYVNVRHLPRFFDYSTELSYSKTERVTNIDDIQHPAIRNAMKMLDMHEIRLTYEADLPARSGLGTSSSFAVGMLNAFYALKGKYADKKKLAEELGIGEITLTDIVKELEKPARDPREDMPRPILRSDVLDMKDLKPGMVLKGTVRNVIDFGVFVDIGVHQDGLVHISQITDRFIKHPLEAVSVGDIVDVKVLDVDTVKKRIGLTMRLDQK